MSNVERVRIRPPASARGTGKPLRIKPPSLVRARSSSFLHLHAHSEFSTKDALPAVPEMVAKAASLGHPGLALTDHGNMSGAVQLYQECRERGIKPYPGIEAYFTPSLDALKKSMKDKTKDTERFHMGFVALSNHGYESLVRLSTRTHNTGFHHKPHVQLDDLAEWADNGMSQDLALTTGCYFGYVTQTLVHKGESATRQLLKTLSGWFPNTYVELQRHDIEHDDEWTDEAISEALYDIANDLGLPVIITNDSHYCDLEDKPYHDAMKRMVSWGDDPDDATFPGDGFHLCDYDWLEDHYEEKYLKAAEEGWADVLEHDVVIPELEEYSYRVPSVVADPLKELKTRCVDRLIELGLSAGLGSVSKYDQRLDDELEVIEYTGFAGYLMLVASLCDWMRDEDIFYLARGSASGSLVCYLLRISQHDPLEWKLTFERFLSKDRTKPPDIDLDIEKFEGERVLQQLDERFTTLRIGTYGTLGINGDSDENAGRGSLVVAYNSYRKRLLESQGKEAEYLATIKAIQAFEPKDAQLLEELNAYDARSAPGQHAAGVIITSTKDELERLVPSMYIPSSKSFVSQFTMDDVEALGLVKLDVLRVRMLSAVKEGLKLVGSDMSIEDIPLRDSKVYTMLRRGETSGVFQMEGYAATKGCKEMKVKSVHDLILVNALYRPATLDTGVTRSFIQRRAGWEKVTYPHPMLERHLKETHGLTVYQEQVISILRDLGFDREELTEFLKAVKASNKKVASAEKVVEKYAELFNDYSTDAGFSDKARKKLWRDIEGFSEYSFNRAHATSYGILGAQTAWMKYHHKLEWAAALLRTARKTPDKEKKYIIDVRKEFDIKLLRPDINISDAFWTIDRRRQCIRKGLMSIKGIGEKSAIELAEHAPYETVEDIIERCDARKVSGGKNYLANGEANGTIKLLQEAGALKSIGLDRG